MPEPNIETDPIHGVTNQIRLGRAIRSMRKSRQLTQADLAEQASISLPCLRDLETGARSVGVANLLRVLQCLDCTLTVQPKTAGKNEDFAMLDMPSRQANTP